MLNPIELKQEIMDEEAKRYSCGDAIRDHDWVSTTSCGCNTMQLGNNQLAAILDAQTGCSVMCNWCSAVLDSNGKLKFEVP